MHCTMYNRVYNNGYVRHPFVHCTTRHNTCVYVTHLCIVRKHNTHICVRHPSVDCTKTQYTYICVHHPSLEVKTLLAQTTSAPSPLLSSPSFSRLSKFMILGNFSWGKIHPFFFFKTLKSSFSVFSFTIGG